MPFYVYHCPPESQGERTIPLSGGEQYPTCEGGEGQWIEWGQLMDWSFSQLDPETAAAAFGAGFVIVAMAFVVGRPLQQILSMIRLGK